MSDSLRRHFSRGAAAYQAGASVQRGVARRVDRMLTGISAARILELGCGSGFLTSLLCERFPEAAITAVDLSSAMLDLARTAAGPADIQFVCEDIAAYVTAAPAGQFDLIVSSAALHWLDLNPEFFHRLLGLRAGPGALVFSLMLDGTLSELHNLRADIAPENLPRRRLPRMEEILGAAAAAGWSPAVSEVEHREEVFADALAFFRAIRARGFTGGDLSQGSRPLCRRELERLMTEYQRRHARAGGTPASYQLGYFRFS